MIIGENIKSEGNKSTYKSNSMANIIAMIKCWHLLAVWLFRFLLVCKCIASVHLSEDNLQKSVSSLPVIFERHLPPLFFFLLHFKDVLK